MNLADRTVLVTGATSGVGLALAKGLAERGACVVAHGRNPERLAAVATAVGGVSVRADLADPAGPAYLVRETLSAVNARGWPPPSILINNAAVQRTYLFSEQEPAEVARAVTYEVTLDLTAPIEVTARLLSTLQTVARETGSPSALVNVTSGLALAPKKTAAVYGAAKAGLRTFTKALRYQIDDEAAAGGPALLVVEAMLPLVDTPMTAGRATRLAKIPPEQAASEILDGLVRGRTEIAVGKARVFRHLHRWLPRVAERMLRDG